MFYEKKGMSTCFGNEKLAPKKDCTPKNFALYLRSKSLIQKVQGELFIGSTLAIVVSCVACAKMMQKSGKKIFHSKLF